MRVEMSKTKRTLCLVALMLTNLAVMNDLVVIPVISNLYGEFADHMGLVNYIVSGPALIIVLTSLLASFLCKKLDKKVVLIIGGIFFTVGSILGVMMVNPYYMAFMRTLVGIGAGIEQVVAVSMIADVYEDENERAKATGYYNATMSFVGIAYSYLAGVLANSGVWKNAFMCYWAAIPMLIFLFLFVPSVKPDKNVQETGDGSKESLGSRFWVLEISWFILCLFFGGIYKVLKRNTITVSYFIAAVTLVFMVVSPSRFSAVVIATICGCCYKVVFSYMYAHGFSLVPASRIDDSVGITTAVYGIGTFCSTYFATWLMGVMHTDRATETWMVAAVLFAVLGVDEVFLTNSERKNVQK